MSKVTKALASPFSTGGGGLNFETRVQSAFAVLMLADGFAPCLRQWPISAIHLQAKYLGVKDEDDPGYQIDDLIIIASKPNSSRSVKLLAQVKHKISIRKSNKEFREVIGAAWKDFNNSKIYSQGEDAIALIVGPLAETDYEIRTVLEWARNSGGYKDFFDKVNLEKLSSKKKREKLAVIRHNLKLANGGVEVPDDATWRFLKDFHLLVYDLDIEAGVNLAFLHSIIGQFDPKSVGGIWSQIVDKVQTINQNAGVINKDTLPDDIVDAFRKAPVQTIPATLAAQPAAQGALSWMASAELSSLVPALLVGAWDENNESDKKILSKIACESYDDWILKVRNFLHLSDKPVKLKQQIWSVVDRELLLTALSDRLFDNHLDSLQECAIQVLKEVDPKFELDEEQRFAAEIHGKRLSYSRQLRNGLADGLAMIANSGNALTNCSTGKARGVAIMAVRGIFDDD